VILSFLGDQRGRGVLQKLGLRIGLSLRFQFTKAEEEELESDRLFKN